MRVCGHAGLYLGFVINWLHAVGCGATGVTGVAPASHAAYTPGSPFRCDGDAIIPFARVNDDWCDCADGTDEPGTSACPNGRFWCINAGYVAQGIHSSAVGDGVCDCCDGSDEGERCPNRCNAEAAAWHEAQQQQAELHEKGHARGQELLQEAKQTLEALKVQHEKVRREYCKGKGEPPHVPSPDGRPDAPLIANPNCQAPRHTEPKSGSAAEEKPPPADGREMQITFYNDAEVTLHVFYKSRDENGSPQEAFLAEVRFIEIDSEIFHPITSFPGHEFVAKVTAVPWLYRLRRWWEGKSPLTIGAEAHWVNPNTACKELSLAVYQDESQGWGLKAHAHCKEHHAPKEEAKPTAGKAQADGLNANERHAMAMAAQESPQNGNAATAPDGAAQPGEGAAQPGGGHEAEEGTQPEEHLKSIEAELVSLEDEIRSSAEVDYGPDGRHLQLRGSCHTLQMKEYHYTVCPFSNVTQANTLLGKWNGWKDGSMHFNAGEHCWQAGAREATVLLSCGLESKVLAVTEPATCKYHITMSSPSACDLAYATRLRSQALAGPNGMEGQNSAPGKTEL